VVVEHLIKEITVTHASVTSKISLLFIPAAGHATCCYAPVEGTLIGEKVWRKLNEGGAASRGRCLVCREISSGRFILTLDDSRICIKALECWLVSTNHLMCDLHVSATASRERNGADCGVEHSLKRPRTAGIKVHLNSTHSIFIP